MHGMPRHGAGAKSAPAPCLGPKERAPSSLRGMMRPPRLHFESRSHGAETSGRVDTPTFSTESSESGLSRLGCRHATLPTRDMPPMLRSAMGREAANYVQRPAVAFRFRAARRAESRSRIVPHFGHSERHFSLLETNT